MPATSIELEDRAAWLAWRRKGIGGSDAAAILGLHPYRSPLQVFADKTRLIEEEELQNPEAAYWGTTLEPLVARRFCEITGRELRQHGPFWVVQGDLGFMLASPDDEQIAGIGNPPELPAIVAGAIHGDGLLEIKTRHQFGAADWKEEPPVHYQIQLQHYFAVTGLKWGSFAVLIGGQELRWIDVERNERFIEVLKEKEEAFWIDVKEGRAPQATALDHDLLAKLFPREKSESIVKLPEEALEIDARLVAAKGDEKDAKEVRELLEARLKQLIGDAAVGVLPSGVAYTFKTTNRKGYSVEATSYRSLRRTAAK